MGRSIEMLLTDIITFFESFFGAQPIFLTTISIFMLMRVYLLFKFAIFSFSGAHTQRARFFLMLFLASFTFVDSAWLFKLIRDIFIGPMDYRPYLFWLRLAWGALVIQYQALALFLEFLVHQRKFFSHRQKFFITISAGFVLFAIAIAFLDINCSNPADRPYIEFIVRYAQMIYIQFILFPPSLAYAIWHLCKKPLPLILKKQLKILLIFFIIPIWICDTLQGFPISSTMSYIWMLNSYAATSMSQLLSTIVAYYCARKVMSLRFLNLQNHVQSLSQFHFVNSFRSILEQLGHAASVSELKHITQNFFKESFLINQSDVVLHVREENSSQEVLSLETNSETRRRTSLIEAFISTDNEALRTRTSSLKVLLYDEIAFSNFYDTTISDSTILSFLDNIHTDIFLPIYEGEKMVAYITVKRHARNGELYSDVDRDEMLIFASYLGNVINLLKNRNLLTMLHNQKMLKEELYLKHQEINQYKESIRSFLRNQKQQAIGIIFYANRQFTFGNKAAKELVNVNINAQEGHPLSKAIRSIARQVEAYKEPQQCFCVGNDGTRMVIAGMPSLERNTVIIMIYNPEISDVVKKQIEILHDPTEWDYLLYLETTQSGKLINQLIPGTGETLMAFKIQLLKAALSKKALLLNVAEDDLMPTVEIIHHTSLRETLRVHKLTGPAKTHDSAIALFGANPILSIPQEEKPLLEQLDNIGTLVIQNIHFLELAAQNQLAEFIKYGVYRRFKSDQIHTSDVRIICSTNQDLQHLVSEGAFSKSLYNELYHTTLTMPPLMSLSEDELSKLVEGVTEQTLATQDFKNMVSLSDRDKHRLSLARPVSLQELKKRVQTLLMQKSKNNLIQEETLFDPAYHISDPQLVEASRLGKHALRDSRLMAILWHKFKSQSKIASFLNVNRSSVSRRLKEHGLIN